MSQTIITHAFEQWRAEQDAAGEPVVLDGFILAYVPGLDPVAPASRDEGMPPDDQIVHRQDVSHAGVVNQNTVVYSVTLGADTGDFRFNWIGLVNKARNLPAMIVHAPEQQKIKNAAGQQGNVLTRSFLMEYSGAAAQTQINIPAESWQIDFSARLAAVDERQRHENADIYGAAAFFADGWLVTREADGYWVSAGTGYVAGLRVVLGQSQSIAVTQTPVMVWLDACFQGTVTSVWQVETAACLADSLSDYDAEDGRRHYVTALARINEDGSVSDLRPRGSLAEQSAAATAAALAAHEQSRHHPDATTDAKGFTQLSSATDSDSETMAATPKAVKAAYDNAVSASIGRLYPVGIVLWFAENKDPNALFPGTIWKYIGENRTIRLASADGSDVMATGGSDTVTLSVDNLPAHGHEFTGSTSSYDYGTKTTNSTGEHTHNYGAKGQASGNSTLVWCWDANVPYGKDRVKSVESSGDHIHSVNIGSHSDSVSGNTANTGSGAAASVVNVYIKLMGWYRSE